MYLLTFLLLPSIAFASWPMFHGNAQSSGLSDVEGPSTPVVKWRFKDDGIYLFQFPIVGGDGTIYIIRGTEYMTWKDTNTIYAITPDGKKKWKYASPERYFSPLALAEDGNLYSVARPLQVDEGKTGSYLVCISSVSGNLLWERPLSIYTSDYWIPHIVIGHSGWVYVSAADTLAVFNSDGTKVWSYKFFSSPQISFTPSTGPVLSRDEGAVYLLKRIGDEGLYAFDTETGKIKWQEKIDFVTELSSPTVGPDGTIYIANGKDSAVYAITPGGKRKWTTASFQGKTLSRATPTIGTNGIVYVDAGNFSGKGGAIYALNATDGKIKWSFALPEDGSMASVMVVDKGGNIYYGHGNGVVYSLNSAGKLNWEILVGKKAVRKDVEPDYNQISYTGISLIKGSLYLIVIQQDKPGELIAVGEK